MKKLHISATALLLTAALLLSGCSKQNDTSLPNSDSGNSSEISDSSNSSSENSGNPDNSESTPEPTKPDGEPTFLLCPDGEPLYTSEITEIYTERIDGKKTITIAEAEQIARSEEGNFTVRCDGFVYGHIPEKALNCVDDPEMFEVSDSGTSFKFPGEMPDKNEDAPTRKQSDWLRLKVGDKYGELTVKNAYTIFNDNNGIQNVHVFGAHISDGYIEFDGEAELEGYVNITPMDTLYGSGGDMNFFPNGESSTKLPDVPPNWARKGNEYYDNNYAHSYGYYGAWTLKLGNMFEIDGDTSGLHPGDSLVKVRITIDNIRYLFGMPGGMKFDLKHIEVL